MQVSNQPMLKGSVLKIMQVTDQELQLMFKPQNEEMV